MVIRALILTTNILFVGIFSVFSQDSYTICDVKNEAFISGEKLQYSLYYNWNFVWIPAGILEFSVIENDEKYEIEVSGRTLESYDWFFKVDDHYSCIIDIDSFRPESYTRKIHEGDYRVNNVIEFDYKNHLVKSSVEKNGGTTRYYEFPLENCILDLLSLTYKLRNISIDSLKLIGHLDMQLIFDEKIYTIPFRYLGEARSKLIKGFGRMDLYKISPDLIAGHVFKENSDMILWVTKDKNRIPLMIESPIKVGSLKAILKNYEKLKYPLETIKP
jgi:hypothetical protein